MADKCGALVCPPDRCTEWGKQLAAEASVVMRGVGPYGLALGPFRLADADVERAGDCVDANDIAFSDLGDGSPVRGFG